MDQPIPVICDRCRIEGEAGAVPFAALADLLSFSPVPRRAHANGWTPEHQRGFIAALAVTGSPPRAARAIGRHAFGADQLRRAKGGSSFAAAWDAALEIARERELAALKDNLADLAAEHDAEYVERRSVLLPREDRADVRPERVEGPYSGPLFDPDDCSDFAREQLLDAQREIRGRLTRARRLFLMSIADNPAARSAWEVLVGPTDWDAAERGDAQPDEPFYDPDLPERNIYSMRNPDMLMTAEAGWLAEFTGGHDRMEKFRADVEAEVARIEREEGAGGEEPGDAGENGEEPRSS